MGAYTKVQKCSLQKYEENDAIYTAITKGDKVTKKPSLQRFQRVRIH